MADKKISALTGATTPLAGTEVLPIVQSGATVKVAVSDLTAGRAVATAGGSFTDNIVQNTAGKGINFAANTSAAGMTSELLNWYEEGTWTPAGNGVTFANAVGKYVRIGRLVQVQGQVRLPVTSNTSALQIQGLPYSNGATYPSAGSVGYISPATAIGLNLHLDPSSSTIKCYGNVGETYPTNADWSNAFITFAMTYQV